MGMCDNKNLPPKIRSYPLSDCRPYRTCWMQFWIRTSVLNACKKNYNWLLLPEDMVHEIHLLVKMDNKNKYSVYEMIPLSLRFLNIFDDPFFKVGVLSLICWMSFSVSVFRFSRAAMNGNFVFFKCFERKFVRVTCYCR